MDNADLKKALNGKSMDQQSYKNSSCGEHACPYQMLDGL